ncbi:YcaO-like family protein [Serinicoccus sp. LYQ131]|uniref:YcaO-like family protein n=1 Tax=Serinicoccus sp. LYQ131 TaxID=3378797 RepID=UPI00385419D6
MTFTSWRRTAGELTLPGRPFLWGGRGERELSGEQAWARIHGDLDDLGWTSSARWAERDGPSTAQCILRDGGGTEVELGVGAGKGRLDVALVGSHFEALEHAVTGPSWAEGLPVTTTLRGDPELTGAWAGEEWVGLLPDTARLTTLRATALGPGEDFPAPVFRSAPWLLDDTPEVDLLRRRTGDDTDYRAVAAYASNSGSAIGATADEAILHGLNEAVERDALSLFLLLHVLGGGPAPPRLTVPEEDHELAACLASAEEALGSPIAVLDITTDLGIPTVLCLAGTGTATPVYGSGASLDPRVAVERALTEIVQGHLLRRAVQDPGGTQASGATRPTGPGPHYLRLAREQSVQHQAVQDRFVSQPALLRCATLRLGDLSPPERVEPVPERAACDQPLSVPDQVAAVVRRLEDAGHRVGWVPLHTFGSGTTVGQVHVPGLESFHQVLVGHAPRPGARARRLRERVQV